MQRALFSKVHFYYKCDTLDIVLCLNHCDSLKVYVAVHRFLCCLLLSAVFFIVLLCECVQKNP